MAPTGRPIKAPWYSRLTTGFGPVEFAIYTVVILFVGYYRGTRLLWERSAEARQNGTSDSYLLSTDRFGPVDRTDYQWTLFLSLQWQYWTLAVVFLALSYGVRRYFVDEIGRSSSKARSIFYSLFGLAFIGYACRLQIFVPLAIVVANFGLVKAFAGKKFAPWIFWAFNLGVLYVTNVVDRYAKMNLGLEWMDGEEYRGLMAWNEVCYIIFLNCISFSMDYHWMLVKRPSPIDFSKNGEDDKKNLTWTWREETSLPEEEYSFVNFFAFVFYFPTWMGPIGGFNAFVSQLKLPQRTSNQHFIPLYALRLVAALVLKEVLDHLLYANAINTDLIYSGEIERWSLLGYAIIPYYILLGIWFKFMIMWRSWRLLALLDGMEYPENMNRCMSNNYTLEGFWRSWHSSFNQWLLRYIYIPLGGSWVGLRRHIFNIFTVFTAVVYFHAPQILREPHYLFWGYGMAIFMVPEVLAQLFVSKFYPDMPNKWYYRHLVSLGGAFNIFVLVLANMLGYGFRFIPADPSTREGVVLLMLRRLFDFDNWWFFLCVGGVLFSSVQFMLLFREYEKERDGKAKTS